MMVALVLATALACGQSEPEASQPESAGTPSQAASLEPAGGARIVLSARTFTVDDLVQAGWKKSKQFPADSLPGAKEVWYGFFDHRDIEVRVYESHASAIGNGQAPAFQATQRQRRRGGGEVGAGHESITAYNAYMIAGNLVVLCEVDVASCEGLIEKLQ